MPYCITLTKELKVHKREKLKKGQKPREGFQRQSNNNYVKILGDPRCISFEEKKQEVVQKVTPPPLPYQPSLPYSYSRISKNETKTVKAPISMEEQILLGHFFHGWKEHYISNKVVLFGAKPKGKIGISEIDDHAKDKYITKVEILKDEKIVNFWLHNSAFENPDYTVTGLLE